MPNTPRFKPGDIVIYRNAHTGSVAVAVVTWAAGTYSIDIIAGRAIAEARIREEDLRPCDYPTFKSIDALNEGTRTLERQWRKRPTRLPSCGF